MNSLTKILYKKAIQSSCRYLVSAVGLNRKGEVVALSFNKERFNRKGGGLHAEEYLMKTHPKSLKTIIIGRFSKRGVSLPISPCKKCTKLAKKLDITIKSIDEL